MKNESCSAELSQLIEALEQHESMIPPARKNRLADLAGKILLHRQSHDPLSLIFICTHNSRRSQLAEAWMHFAKKHYQISGLEVYSAGTEATAFNIRMVDALNRVGFNFEKQDDSENPIYQFQSESVLSNPKRFFSKTWETPSILKHPFLAIMVCNDADKNCPFIPGSLERFSLSYLDPKSADDTTLEQQTYDLKILEIGRELLYLARQL